MRVAGVVFEMGQGIVSGRRLIPAEETQELLQVARRLVESVGHRLDTLSGQVAQLPFDVQIRIRDHRWRRCRSHLLAARAASGYAESSAPTYPPTIWTWLRTSHARNYHAAPEESTTDSVKLGILRKQPNTRENHEPQHSSGDETQDPLQGAQHAQKHTQQ